MTEERCGTTELLVSACGCPQHRGGRTPQEEADTDRQPGPWFVASYAGVCSNDSEGVHYFNPGEYVRADGRGGWECHE